MGRSRANRTCPGRPASTRRGQTRWPHNSAGPSRPPGIEGRKRHGCVLVTLRSQGAGAEPPGQRREDRLSTAAPPQLQVAFSDVLSAQASRAVGSRALWSGPGVSGDDGTGPAPTRTNSSGPHCTSGTGTRRAGSAPQELPAARAVRIGGVAQDTRVFAEAASDVRAANLANTRALDRNRHASAEGLRVPRGCQPTPVLTPNMNSMTAHSRGEHVAWMLELLGQADADPPPGPVLILGSSAPPADVDDRLQYPVAWCDWSLRHDVSALEAW